MNQTRSKRFSRATGAVNQDGRITSASTRDPEKNPVHARRSSDQGNRRALGRAGDENAFRDERGNDLFEALEIERLD